MKNFTQDRFWKFYERLPQEVQRLADKNFELLKYDSFHPSLHFKKVNRLWWSVRVGEHYRALAAERLEGMFWFWIGTHAEYDRILKTF